MTHPLMFFVDMDTPQWKLDKLEKSFFDFLAASPKWFNKADSALLYRDCPSGNALKLGFYSVSGGSSCWIFSNASRFAACF